MSEMFYMFSYSLPAKCCKFRLYSTFMAIAPLRERVVSSVTQDLSFQISSRGPVALTCVSERLVQVMELSLRIGSLAAGIQTPYSRSRGERFIFFCAPPPTHWLFLVLSDRMIHHYLEMVKILIPQIQS